MIYHVSAGAEFARATPLCGNATPDDLVVDEAARSNCDECIRLFVRRSAHHNHITRDIKRPGICPACDHHHHMNRLRASARA